MHLEVLVEGQSERTALEPLLAKILGPYKEPHTWRIYKHRGLGSLPDDLDQRPDPKNPTLLHNLPAKIRAYGRTLSPSQAVLVLVDLDDRPDCNAFLNSLLAAAQHCQPAPRVLVRIAIEELEAWYLGDRQALLRVYPRAKRNTLDAYAQDSQCGTWEVLADAVYPGGSRALKSAGPRACLQQKREWARDMAAAMEVDENDSPSFQKFRDGLRRLAASIP